MTPPAFSVIIPARLASSRLPNKPLADIAGLPMVVRVARQALQSAAQQVVVAADSPEIVQACQVHGIQALLTDVEHPSGSDRLAQASQLLGLDDAAIVVNVQGDEPLIAPSLIDALAQTLAAHPQASMATAAHPLTNWEQYHNPHIVKLVCNGVGMAQYFSRAPIPCHRDSLGSPEQPWWDAQSNFAPLRHIGIYAYRAGFLRQFPLLTPAPTEQAEALEQLRALWHGHAIAVHISEHAPGPGVDTAQDLALVRQLFAQN